MTKSFDWEEIHDYERLTGIEPVDKALAYNDPVPLLKRHLARREREEGRDAVVADLKALIEATQPGSPAHDGSAEWLKRYQTGASAEDLWDG
jgi:hypothetical protein